MNRITAIILLTAAALGAAGQDTDSVPAPVALRGISVAARRVADVGRQETRIDSAALRENVALSLADVLGFNSSAYIKNFGRATLATVTFRGTSPSHTQVTWNGMRISSPMLGSTDFSMIPGYFVDDARLVHGSSSLTDTGGGIGGLVRLGTSARTWVPEGFSAQYVQGVGMWRTFDEFLRLGYGRGPWRVSLRTSYSSSPNDFPFTNRDKKVLIYDDDNKVIGSYHPRERNRSGSFKDFHTLLSASYDAGHRGRWGIDAWYMSSNRELPLLTTDYSSNDFENRQREHTFRTVASWNRTSPFMALRARAGYIHTWLAYDYRRGLGGGVSTTLTRSRSHVNTLYAAAGWSWYPTDSWLFTADIDAHRHSVDSHDNALAAPGSDIVPGYDRSRIELSASLSAKWRPVRRFGAGIVLRQETFGSKVAAPVPAVFADYTLIPAIGLTAKASASRNYRFPTLNDLYTTPGGNPDLRPEQGWTYDLGLSSQFTLDGRHTFSASAGWFDSRITDWIQWLPSPKGFYVPSNVKEVHAYGIEAEAAAGLSLPRGWRLDISASYTWSASINCGEPVNDADRSVGKQLPYVPRHSASAVLRVGWRGWELAYKIQAYSERFTMSSNEYTITGHLPGYSLSNLSLDKSLNLFGLQWHAKAAVNNLFDADYRTVLSRPMPGINVEFFLALTI